MRKYIILGWCGGMGGGQIYTKNKCAAARLAGWEPVVIHSKSIEVFLKELKQFQDNVTKELSLLPCYYTHSQQEKVVNRMIDMIQPEPGDTFFVESNGTRMAFWGELLAKKLHCKHFAFLLEYYFPWSDDHIDYFMYKLNRNEMSVIKRDNLRLLFNNREGIRYDEIPIMHPICMNSFDDSEDTLGIDYSRYDVIIGNIGRSTKPYVESLGPEIQQFAIRHSGKKILFIMIGGDPDSPVARQHADLFKGISNLDYVNTGFLYPIPQSLLAHLDIAIGTSGCIPVGVRNGVKTIAYADNDNQPYGLMGYDLLERKLQNNERCGLSLSDLLEDIFFGSYCDRYEYKQLYKPALSYDRIMEVLMNDITYMTAPVSNEYYDTSKILPQQFLRRAYVKIIGGIIPYSSVLQILKKVKS